jgi:hypothetical protein
MCDIAVMKSGYRGIHGGDAYPVDRAHAVERRHRRRFVEYEAAQCGPVVVVAHHLDGLSIQLRGQWLNPGARLAIWFRLAYVSQIAVEQDGIRALAQNVWVSGR